MLAHRFCLALLAGALLSSAHANPATAQTRADTLRIADAIDLALRDSPRVRASRLRAETRREGIAQAGALPDPMLSVGLLNRPFDFGADQPMTMNSLQLSQRLPWKGKRSSSTEAAEGLTRAADMDAAEASVSVVQQLRSHYYRMAYMDRAVAVMERTRGLLSDLQGTASTMYSVGTGVQQDMLQAQVAEARMVADIRVMQEQRIASGARFNALLGRRPDDPIGALELPELPDEVESLEELMRLAESRPAVQAARARVEAATAARAGAYRAHLPDVNVTLGYGQRPNFDDLFTVMIGVPLPVRRGSVQEPLRRQTTAAEAAAEASEVELYNETYAQLAERRAQAARAIELSELLRTDVVPQAQAAVESGLSAYRVGALDFMAVLQSQMTVNQFEVERLRLAAEYQSALAAIDALIGVIPGGVR